MPPECTLEDALELAKQIGQAKDLNPWLAGDWCIETEARWPHEYAQGEKYLGYSEGSLLNIIGVCLTFPPPSRNVASFSHYTAVKKIANTEGRLAALTWLQRAALQGWSVAELRRQVYGAKPRVKKWSLDELQEKAHEYTNGGLSYDIHMAFLYWLESGEKA